MAKRKHKYNARRIFRNGRTWDSTGEYGRYCELQLLEKANAIQDLECQPKFSLTKAEIGYCADFSYIEDGRQVVEDFKGVRTPRFNIICRLWKHYGPCLLRITGRRGRSFTVTEEIMPEVADENTD